MIYRRFGKTDLAMPVLSFGCMRSMHAWPDDPAKPIPATAQQQLTVIVEQALAHGITHIETAQGYGSSERQLGTILPNLPRRSYLLQTKAPPCADPDQFTTSVLQSLERLRVDRLDLLAIHGINDHRTLWQSCRKNGCLAAARRLQDRGIVDHIGFSGHAPLEVIRAAAEHEEDGGFDYLNLHWYYIFDVNRPAIEAAAARDLGIFIISPTDKGGHLHHPSKPLRELTSPLSPMLFNDFWCLQQPGVCTISVGASAPEQFGEHLRVLPLLEQQSTDLLDDIDDRLRQAMAQATGNERPDAHWLRMPPWDNAPGLINLPMVIWLYNLLRGWGMKEYARTRYRMLGRGSSWVPGNHAGSAAKADFSGISGTTGMTSGELKKLLIKAHRALN
jgi:predicted aldo/keto reductase-like oxidoreductase